MTLTDEQVKRLASDIVDTGRNVYQRAKTLFGEEVEEEVFDQLAKVGDIFKCEMCDTWMGCCNRAEGFDDTCVTCIDGEIE